ncbi:rhomboid family protein [Sediminitomix flava]|uniref:Membrane associated rhomboid family serine protease n=1 Tax=Sediminitomix flava TaxID=379075 RepID=A0A315Z072_SEDFL|nr:rhomboid family intramembrane serine protease [Sediminitomix flava]PWJ36067.1 membrane associated rhomboid family serine protease [Sediminitomix flava]
MNTFVNDFKSVWNRPNNIVPRLIIINVAIFVLSALVYLVCKYTGNIGFYQQYIFRNYALPPDIVDFLFHPWTLVTYFFSHSINDFLHIIFNMLLLYWFGDLLGQMIGERKVLALYVLGGLAGGLIYLLSYNLIPPLVAAKGGVSGLVGASASVYAIIIALATLSPDYKVPLLLFGPVKLKYIAIVPVAFSLFGIAGPNAGGNIAHLGGALIGFVYIRSMQKGNDIGRPILSTLDFLAGLFSKKPRLKVTKNKKYTNATATDSNGMPDQKIIDAILDKISESGYEKLSKEEKELLFKASQKKH